MDRWSAIFPDELASSTDLVEWRGLMDGFAVRKAEAFIDRNNAGLASNKEVALRRPPDHGDLAFGRHTSLNSQPRRTALCCFTGDQLGNSVTLTQLDHWTQTSGGNWTTASSWTTWNGTHAVPIGTVDADFDTSGTYTVKITTADTAYALLLNDSGATISDNSGGTLMLVGTGRSSNPNGMLTINAGVFALAGGVLKSGSISIGSGGVLLLSASYTGFSNAIVDNGSISVSGKNSTVSFAGNISGSGAINIQNGAAAIFNGVITGSEAFTIANNSKAIINTAMTGTGSFALSGSGSLELGAADSEDVTFTSGASGTLKIDHSLTAPFTGYLSGLSAKNAVDLADLAWTLGKMKATFSGNTSGGTLTITNGTNSVALKLLGNYTTASWTLSKDGTGGTRVVDPPVTGSTMTTSGCIDYSGQPSSPLAGCIDYPSHSSPTLAGCIDYTSPSSPTLAGCIDYPSHSSPTLAGCIDYPGQSSSPLAACVDYPARHV
jgi:hypothetical protein